jgi:hypothetical protein
MNGPGRQNSDDGAGGDGEAVDNDGQTDNDSGINGTLSSYRRIPRSAGTGAAANRVQPVSGPSLDSYRRPTASRLFSPAR